MIARLYANRIAGGVMNAKTGKAWCFADVSVRKREEVAALLIADGHADLVPAEYGGTKETSGE